MTHAEYTFQKHDLLKKIQAKNDEIGELYGELRALERGHYSSLFEGQESARVPTQAEVDAAGLTKRPSQPVVGLDPDEPVVPKEPMDPATRIVLRTMPDPPRENVTLSKKTNK